MAYSYEYEEKNYVMRGRIMVQTVVCKKDGCSGNEFHIVTEDNQLK